MARHTTFRCLIAAAAAALVSAEGTGSAFAADGDLDPGFGRGGRMMTDFHHGADIAYAVALQPDGRIVAGGTTYQDNDFSGEDFALARYQPNGRLDPTFGVNGRVTTDFPGLAAQVSAIVVQPDGKILVAGGAYPLFTFAGNFELARYHPNGSLDTSFGTNGIVTTNFMGHGSYASALALQPDGKIVAAGTAYVDFRIGETSDTDFALARYLPDGRLDPSFGNGGLVTTDFEGFEDDAFSVLLQPDGKIVAVGSANSVRSYYDFALARYLSDGRLDESFGRAGRVRTDFGDSGFDRARSALLQPDGRIVAAGFAIRQSGAKSNFAVARYRANGALDAGFGAEGMTQISFGSCCQSAHRVLRQADGKLIVVGYPDSESSDSDFVLARLDRQGVLDPGFGRGGRVRTSFGELNGGATDAALQADGKIVAVGFQATNTAQSAQFVLARYLDGTP